jgi:hypothetical protein
LAEKSGAKNFKYHLKFVSVGAPTNTADLLFQALPWQ